MMLLHAHNTLLLQALMLNDGCLGSASYAACANVSGGLFGMGLHAVIQQLSANTASLLAQRSMSTSTSAEVPL